MIKELQTFLISAFVGMLVVVYYDFFRILRSMVRHSTWMVAVEDLLFSLGTGCMILAVSYRYDQGRIRSYLLFGLIGGMLLYNVGISPFLRGIFLFFYKKITQGLKKVKKSDKIEQNKDTKEEHYG